MPPDFTKCIKDGGRVRTIKPSADKHMAVCFDKGGKSHAGEVKTTKKKGKSVPGPNHFQMQEDLARILREAQGTLDRNAYGPQNQPGPSAFQEEAARRVTKLYNQNVLMGKPRNAMGRRYMENLLGPQDPEGPVTRGTGPLDNAFRIAQAAEQREATKKKRK